MLGETRAFLRDELQLALKAGATRIAETRRGVPFLGFRVLPSGIEVRRETFRRFRRGLRQVEGAYRAGRLGDAELAASVSSRLAHLKRARSRGLRVRFFASWPEVMW